MHAPHLQQSLWASGRLAWRPVLSTLHVLHLICQQRVAPPSSSTRTSSIAAAAAAAASITQSGTLGIAGGAACPAPASAASIASTRADRSSLMALSSGGVAAGWGSTDATSPGKIDASGASSPPDKDTKSSEPHSSGRISTAGSPSVHLMAATAEGSSFPWHV